jgi:hypothetical protein
VLQALPNPRITFKSFVDPDFWVCNDSVFADYFRVNRVTFGISFGDDFGVGRGLVFIDYFQVNRGCARLGIQASPSEVVSLTFSKSTGAASASESTRHL